MVKSYVFFIIVFFGFLTSCGVMENLFFDAKVPGFPLPQDVSAFKSKAIEYRQRLMTEFLENGYVVSKREGKPHHRGDSVLWTMIAAASSPCGVAKRLMEPVFQSLMASDGLLKRIEPLDPDSKTDPTSRDMETGFIFGITSYYIKCPEERSRIEDVWFAHVSYVQHYKKLAKIGVDSKTRLSPAILTSMRYLNYLILEPQKGSTIFHQFYNDIANALGNSFLGGTGVSCYPYHLSTLLNISSSAIGYGASNTNRDLLCRATKGKGLVLTDWYCNRVNPIEYLKDFQPNVWEYRWQRCQNESPDSAGAQTPAVDFLILYAALGGFLYAQE